MNWGCPKNCHWLGKAEGENLKFQGSQTGGQEHRGTIGIGVREGKDWKMEVGYQKA